MNIPFIVKIVSAPVACSEGFVDSWREVADWVSDQLKARYGNKIAVLYYDLLEVDCPTLPDGVQLPVVFVNEEVISSGGKISVPQINKKIKDIEKI